MNPSDDPNDDGLPKRRIATLTVRFRVDGCVVGSRSVGVFAAGMGRMSVPSGVEAQLPRWPRALSLHPDLSERRN